MKALSRPALLLAAFLLLATALVVVSPPWRTISEIRTGTSPDNLPAPESVIQATPYPKTQHPPSVQLPPNARDVSVPLRVEAGTVVENSFFSQSLQMQLTYRVYLPPGYSTGGERYPVIYLLHGGGGSYAEWTDINHIGLLADAMITEGKIRPVLIAMPEGDHSYFMNHAVDGQRWGDYIVHDFVAEMDSHFRTIPDRDNRAIGGLSMGGTGALQLAFNHPGSFSTVVANSPSMRNDLSDAPEYFGDWNYYADYDPIRLAATRKGLEKLKIWLDVGDQDQWRPPVDELHAVLLDQGIPHEYHLNPGYHWTTYWIENTPAYLRFYSRAFAAPAGSASLPDDEFAWAGQAEERRYDEIARLAVMRPTDALTETVAAAVRGLRVYAAMTDSPYLRRQMDHALVDLEQVIGEGAPRGEVVASYLDVVHQAVDAGDIGAMRSLGDKLEDLNGRLRDGSSPEK